MLFLFALACAQLTYDEIDNAPEVIDLQPPIVRTTPIDEPQVYGGDILIEAVIKDESNLLLATLYYRGETGVIWKSKGMNIVGGDGTNGYTVQATISGKDVVSGGLFYYIEAVDDSENENVSCAPERCDEDPYHISVVAP